MDDHLASHNSAQRYFVTGADDSGTENYLDLDGFEGHKPTKILHIQSHGLASSPLPGAHLIGLNLGGLHDSMVAIGGEHPAHKPTGLGAGGVALYNADGSILKMVGTAPTLACSTFTITCGGATFTFSSSGLAITGGNITVNGVAVVVP